MSQSSKQLKSLYDRRGRLFGVLIGPKLWSKVEDKIRPILEDALDTHVAPKPEPLQDWQDLKSYWDFKYPVDTDVCCEVCGNETQNWEEDEPRLFKLKACNIGGLVCFECQKCKARITKRHFKSHIAVETLPHCPDKK
ncbi:MAG: hypothetical protein SVS15_01540 [Thermodesulfobacteriota bacterium]|nr:hypothetical protein [Thermodesulfobacteriota bacterium]